MSKNEQELYASPEARVVEIKVRQLICTSPGTEDYEGGTWNI